VSGARLELAKVAGKQIQATVAALERSNTLERSIKELVALRASQINGCAFCIDMHWKDARLHGEPEERLYGLDAWRESPLYNDRERAALELCEAVTLVADTHVPDGVWAQAAGQFDQTELAQLVLAIAAINLWNRLNITVRTPPGTYQPGALAMSQ
jgi:AhpD family alkylhydroperoxidase